jgi:glycerophosphoryl diester phosphodiesterase
MNMNKYGLVLTIVTSLLFPQIVCGQVMNNKKTQVIAHRGFWNTPGSAQNSIAALIKADSIGCYGSEFDVWMTADHQLMLNHDEAYNGYPMEKTNSEILRSLKLSNGENMPTLEEFLKKAKKLNIRLILELKPHSTPERETEALTRIVKLVKKMKLTKRVEYISFSRHAVCEAVRLAPAGTPVLYLGQDISPKELKQLGITGADYNYWAYRNHADWLDELKGLGMISNAWTVNKQEDMQWCIDNGIDLVTTDAPDLFLKLQ